MKALNDKSPEIRKVAQIHLDNLNKEENIKIQHYKSKFEIN